MLGHALISKRSHYMLDRRKVAVDVDELQRRLAETNTTEDSKTQRPKLELALLLSEANPLPNGITNGQQTKSGHCTPPTSSYSSEPDAPG
jgi:hypothetical protein